ncbi:hypothetical protein [Vreelandella alkaliphila]|uniref:hypothetical protein n=1 Tax=Vreelandella alkaliphila TaxID=272774 RepID=UPI0011AB448C|nr:hypothetical protein [Halomonas alkaliphila]
MSPLDSTSMTLNPSLSDAGEPEPNVFERAAQQADDGEPADDLIQPEKPQCTSTGSRSRKPTPLPAGNVG